MKHRFPALLLSLACLAGAAPDVSAQDYTPVPVTISRSQVNMNGKTYYAHIVLERQTIYGITKAYGVTEKDLYAANPMLAQEGLKAGTVLYVPVVSEQSAAPKPVEKEKPAQKVETPAAQKEKPVRADNKPAVVDTTPTRTPDKDGFIEHTVKWFEDIYDVARTYDVTPQEIMAANGLKSSRISKRQTLRIPVTDKAREGLKVLLPQQSVKEEPAQVYKPVPDQIQERIQSEPQR